MKTNDSSLFIKIIKSENNALVLRDIVVAGMNPYLCRIIKALVGDNFASWGANKVFLEDFKKYRNSPDKSYISTAIFTFHKLVSFFKTPPAAISKFSAKKLMELEYNDLKKELDGKTPEFCEIDLDNLDTAGLLKVINDRVDCDHDTKKLLWNSLENIKELRNEYEGHLTQALKITCTEETVIEKCRLLQNALLSDAQSFKAKLEEAKNTENKSVLNKCYQQLMQAYSFLEEVVKIVEGFSKCNISNDPSKKYTAKDLLGYTVFAVYPDVSSDKFRRFCNNELRFNQAISSGCIYTDTGTISYLEAYALSKNEAKRTEAKQILKDLFSTMHGFNSLKVLKIEEDTENDDYINLSGPFDEERFVNALQQINETICVITDNEYVAKNVWALNSNKDMKNFSAVAVKVYNKQQIVPFYDKLWEVKNSGQATK